ncbi:hypothetical protein [Acinetobacter soli]|uniref:hypothetical protein n=1 Tax=Acinetobacter soli TaxID=487316 RepID=UPI001D0B317D|nr:hypothetical protein [Acinetobacter soli]MCB8769390.1 hypothetical protein [Acinetobacter soli]
MTDALSLTQLEDLSLKSRPTVVKCLNELVKVGLIKKHHQSKYGNVYSLVDHYNIGELIKFPSKKVLLVKEFIPFKNVVVKNFNYPKIKPQKGQNVVEICLKFPSKSSLLVKSFNQTSKNLLPQLVKIFNTQSNTIKKHSQNKKKSWLVLKKLEEQILSATDSIPVETILKAKWFKRELEAFENFNAERNHSPEFKIYLLADWLLNAHTKYQTREQTQNTHQGKRVQLPTSPNHLTDKQITAFSQKLAHHPEFAGFFAHAGESYEQLAARIAVKLSDPAQAKQWEKYLKQVGFSGVLGAAA